MTAQDLDGEIFAKCGQFSFFLGDHRKAGRQGLLLKAPTGLQESLIEEALVVCI
jgi:hypothetical protein